jgi:hypothetical protein
MKPSNRKQKSNSIEAAVSAAQAAAIEPPAHVRLRESDWPFWASIVHARAKENWTAPDLENAANLARCKADIERISREIEAEGDTIENQRGTRVVNPKHTLLETLTRRSMALSRMLHVHAEATVGKSEDEQKSSKTARKARETMGKADDLIARPH